MRLIFLPCLLGISLSIYSQNLPSISEKEVSRIENMLAADDMQGRQVFTPGIDKAADFIKKEFKDAGLTPLPGSKEGFEQSFTMLNPEVTEISAIIDGTSIDSKNILVFSSNSSLNITQADHYQKVYVKKGSDFRSVVYKYLDADQNVLILVDTSFTKNFRRLVRFHMHQFEGNGNRILILTDSDPLQFSIQVNQKTKKQSLTNIAGIIQGKSKPEEYVIFSAHYDHLGIGYPDAKGDSIYNGANDDASGTTAVITLAKYFSNVHNNERSIIFVAFTAEEIGEFGSAYFSKIIDPDKVIAMFNIEMIGTESKWGKNSAYITGFDKSDMGTIIQKNLSGSQFKFYPDPYPEQGLFLRSDNATLAKKGVPAHTISTSKMDSEKYYHKQGDEVGTLDLKNMTEIIRAIGLSAGSIINGQDTPQRVIIE
ncbi:MAG TPA: M28 family peptidase [Puia sp.]|nr:M28 family peptidase [Puia sp.]